MRLTLLAHALLMLLASTSFTVVTFITGRERLEWCYFKYAFENGFGYRYQPEFSFLVTVTYILAFACGLVGFALAYRERRCVIAVTGMVLSFVGLVSFLIEATHWAYQHNLSWLAFSPAAILIITAIDVVPRNSHLPRTSSRTKQLNESPIE